MAPSAIAIALRALRDAFGQLADALEDGSPGDDWVDANASPRGTRWFWAAARGREARGEPGVSIDGRRCLMTRAALHEELQRASKRHKATKAEPAAGVRAELAAELELRCLKGGRHGHG